MNVLEKTRLSKLLDGLEVPEVRLSEKSASLVEAFREELAENLAEKEADVNMEEHSNPFIPNQMELGEIDNKILKITAKTLLKQVTSCISGTSEDPKRPWRIHTNKEKLMRIDNELKRHHERSNEMVSPLPVDELATLLMEGEKSGPIEQGRISESVEIAKKCLPNFQYRATAEKTRGRRHSDSESVILKDSQDVLYNNETTINYILTVDDSVLKKSPFGELQTSVLESAPMLKNTEVTGDEVTGDESPSSTRTELC